MIVSPPPDREPPIRWSVAGIGAAVVLAAFGFLPIADWVPGPLRDPRYADRLGEWASGTAIACGAGVVLAILSRRFAWLWPVRPARRAEGWIVRHTTAVLVATAIVAGLAYATIARAVFDGRPILIDEIVQLRQAQIFAAGHLWLPVPPHPEFFSALNMVDIGHRLYAQFPPGGPALLALGVRAGAPWIVNPLFGIASVALVGATLRAAEPDRRIATAATALFAFAPFTLFMSGSYMNHVPALTGILVGAAALLHGMASDRPRPALALVGGLGFGLAATVRPVDALAFAAPAAVWYVARAVRSPPRWVDAAAALLGVAAPVAGMLWVNAQTTGGSLLFGYEVLWGKAHGLGFHAAPWGQPHTPARGLELISRYVLELQTYLFETPLPSLAPVIGALALSRPLRPADRYLLVSAGLLLGLYFAYWHDGFYLGPRFLFALTPVLALWATRFPVLLYRGLARGGLARRGPRARLAFRATAFTLLVSALIALGYAIPLRGAQYRANARIERWAGPRVAARAGVHGALVFVREAWQDQVVARLWSLGVSRPQAELLYRAADICRLDSAVTRIESLRDAGTAMEDPFSALAPLLDDSANVVQQLVAPGTVLVVQRGYRYSPRCRVRLEETMAGTVPLAPLQLLPGGGSGDDNLYARDLGARDTILLAEHPAVPVYLVRPTSAAAGARPAFYPVARDSVWRAARALTW